MNRLLIIPMSIILGLLLMPSVNSQDINILNSSDSEATELKIYRKVDIDFDSTFNTFYFYTKNRSIEMNFENKRRFNIWEFSVSIDDELKTFIPRPEVRNANDNFKFSHKIDIDDTNLVKVTFWSDNVIGKENEFLYPFDRYESFLLNATIGDSVAYTLFLVFPETFITGDLDVRSISNYRIVNYKCKSIVSRKISTILKQRKERTVEKDFLRIPPEISIIGHQVPGITTDIFEFRENETVKCGNTMVLNLAHTPNVYFERSFFPAKFLFIIMILFFIFTSYYHIKIEPETSLIKTIYKIYLIILTPALVSEFVSVVFPPNRPLTITLYDSVIVTPLLVLLINSIYQKVHSKRHSKVKKKKRGFVLWENVQKIKSLVKKLL